MSQIPVDTILIYHQFPFWNPFLLGGNILFHHPEVAIFSPFFLVNLIFGAVIGLKIQVFLCYFIGFLGTDKLARKLGLSKTSAVLVALVYFGSVHFALHFAEGHIPFTHFCFLPWYIYFVHKSFENFKSVYLASIVLALMILGNGAAVPLLYTALFSSIFFLFVSIESKSFIYFKNLILSALIAVGISMVKFLPMASYLLENKWTGNINEFIPLSASVLSSIFFGLNHSLVANNFPEQFWAWHEYGAYISPLIILLAIVALFANFRKRYYLLVIGLFFFTLGLGNFSDLSPWALLSSLPGFSSARCSGRSFQFLILPMAILAGFGFDFLKNKFKDKKSYFNHTLTFVVVVIIGTNIFLSVSIMNEGFYEKSFPISKQGKFAHVKDGSSSLFKNYLSNRGSLIAPQLSAYKPSRGLVSATGQVLMENAAIEIDIEVRDYTPNRIEYLIVAPDTTTLTISMGYERGWISKDVNIYQDKNGLISFPLIKGSNSIVLTYRTPKFYFGLVISVFFIFLTVYLYRLRE